MLFDEIDLASVESDVVSDDGNSSHRLGNSPRGRFDAIRPGPNVVGEVVADTRRALTLRLGDATAADYIPFEDVRMLLLKRQRIGERLMGVGGGKFIQTMCIRILCARLPFSLENSRLCRKLSPLFSSQTLTTPSVY